MPLTVGIIGAGIGGLSAAIGLRRAGAEVEVRIPFPCVFFFPIWSLRCGGRRLSVAQADSDYPIGLSHIRATLPGY